jgi:hypothetical protein
MPRPELVTVAEPADPIHRSVIENALEEAGIPFLVRNAEVQDLFGAGQIGGHNLLTGPIKIQVEERFADAAIEVLDGLEDLEDAEDLDAEGTWGAQAAPYAEEEDEGDDRDEDATPEEIAQANRWATLSAVWAILWLAGIGSILGVYFGAKALAKDSGSPDFTRRKAWAGIVLGILGIVFWSFAWNGLLTLLDVTEPW